MIDSGYVGWRPGPDWVVQHGGDFNGDGNSDVLLRNGVTSESYVWSLDGLRLTGGGAIGYATGTDWHALG